MDFLLVALTEYKGWMSAHQRPVFSNLLPWFNGCMTMTFHSSRAAVNTVDPIYTFLYNSLCSGGAGKSWKSKSSGNIRPLLAKIQNEVVLPRLSTLLVTSFLLQQFLSQSCQFILTPLVPPLLTVLVPMAFHTKPIR